MRRGALQRADGGSPTPPDLVNVASVGELIGEVVQRHGEVGEVGGGVGLGEALVVLDGFGDGGQCPGSVPGLRLLDGEVVQRHGEVGEVGGGVGLGQSAADLDGLGDGGESAAPVPGECGPRAAPFQEFGEHRLIYTGRPGRFESALIDAQGELVRPERGERQGRRELIQWQWRVGPRCELLQARCGRAALGQGDGQHFGPPPDVVLE